MLKCIAIDDEPLALDKLKLFVSRVSGIQMVNTFVSPIPARNYLIPQEVDLIFLDIQMEEFSGIEFLKSLKVRPYVIITSAYKEYALESYELEVTDYLLKPFGFERFCVAIEKVIRQSAKKTLHPDFIFVKTGYSTERVDLADILYVEGMNEYLQIVTPQRKLMTLQSFGQLEANLPAKNFVRVHKSYLVALDKIERIERHIIIIQDKQIPIGQSYKTLFYQMLN